MADLGITEAAFRALVEGSPDAIALLRQGQFVYVNPALVRLLRYDSPADLLGRAAAEIVHPEERARVVERMRALSQGAAPGPSPYRGIARDGSEVWGEVSSLPIQFEGQPAVVSVIRDLTERTRLTQRLILTDRLAAVGTMASGMAHEINNPLAFVVANLAFAIDLVQQLAGPQAADAPALPDRMRELYAALHEASVGVDRVRRTVRDLRAFSHAAEENTTDLVDPRRVLDLALSMCGPELRRRAKLVTEVKAVPYVLANDARLCQVFLNLLLNAAQAIPEGRADDNEVRVDLGTDDRGHAVFTVADTGIGMSPAVRERIFDPFFTTKPIGEGTGLGLAIVHAIVSAMGGEVAVASVPGRGSTFTVSLPAASATAKA